MGGPYVGKTGNVLGHLAMPCTSSKDFEKREPMTPRIPQLTFATHGRCYNDDFPLGISCLD